MLGRLFCAALCCLAAGCAAIPPQSCPTADWRALGRADGALGLGEARFAEYGAACEGTGAAPDLSAWRAGRAEGLVSFCTETGAYLAGVEGRVYLGVCPEETAAALAAYQRGVTYRGIERQIRSVELDIRDHRGDIRDLERDAYFGRRGRGRNGFRVLALTRIQYHEDEIRRLRRDLAALRAELEGVGG